MIFVMLPIHYSSVFCVGFSIFLSYSIAALLPIGITQCQKKKHLIKFGKLNLPNDIHTGDFHEIVLTSPISLNSEKFNCSSVRS